MFHEVCLFSNSLNFFQCTFWMYFTNISSNKTVIAMAIPAARAIYAPAVFNTSVAEWPTVDTDLSHLFSPSCQWSLCHFCSIPDSNMAKILKTKRLDQHRRLTVVIIEWRPCFLCNFYFKDSPFIEHIKIRKSLLCCNCVSHLIKSFFGCNNVTYSWFPYHTECMYRIGNVDEVFSLHSG